MKDTNKRPKDVKYFEPKEVELEPDVIDSFQLISMIFGVVAFLIKYRFSIWVSFTFFLVNYHDQKVYVPNSKFGMNFFLLVLGFLLIYVFPS